MNLDVFNAFRDSAEESGVIFYYTGTFSQNVVGAIGDSLKERLEAVNASRSARRKVFSTFVEMAQNILHYAADTTEAGAVQKFGALAVGKTEEKFFVACSNPVRVEDIPRLHEKLEPLRQMSLAEVKTAYREQLRNEHHDLDAVSKGSGLGFLTMAREASEPIEYHINFASENGGRADLYLRAAI